MFDKSFKIKPVRRYGQPSYPVIDEDDNVLFVPRESGISDIATKLTRPMVGAALVALASQASQAATTRKPEKYVTENVSSGNLDQEGLSAGRNEKQEEKIPKIRTFSEKEITALLTELRFSTERNEDQEIMGKRAGPIYRITVTEEQARRILEKFFRKNGLNFDYDQPFKKAGVDFTMDAYNAERKIGYEFGYTGKPDLSEEEIKKLRGLSDKEAILLIDSNNFKGLPSGREAVTRLQTTAVEYLKMLYNKGVLKSDRLDEKEIEDRTKRLYSEDEKVRNKAYEELKKCGYRALDILTKALEDKKSDVVEKVIREIRENFQSSVEKYYKSLDSDDYETREKAMRELINMCEDGVPYARKLLEMAKERRSSEVEWRAKHILREAE